VSGVALLFVAREFSAEELEAAYDSLDARRYYAEIERTTRAKVSRTLVDLDPFLEDASVLDYGCGNGLFLEMLRATKHVKQAVGFELPGEPAREALSKGLDVRTDAAAVGDGYRVGVMLDVAEHLSDPIGVMSRLRQLLVPGGYLYIRTPRRCIWDSMALRAVEVPGFRLIGLHWLRTRLSVFHLQLWSDAALGIALRRAGFSLIYRRQELDLSWPIERYISVYLHLGDRTARMTGHAARFLFVRMRLLRNKAVVLATRPAE
jgi:SAM-dependent methyltransferase